MMNLERASLAALAANAQAIALLASDPAFKDGLLKEQRLQMIELAILNLNRLAGFPCPPSTGEV